MPSALAPVPVLSPAERSRLRAEAHHLHPVVTIGADGVTDAVRKELDLALSVHGLVKVRVFSDDRTARGALYVDLAEQLGAAPVQHIGKLFVYWRRPKPKAKAEPDPDRNPGPRVVKVIKFSKSGNHRPQIKKVKVAGNMRLTSAGTLKRAAKRVVSEKKKQAG